MSVEPVSADLVVDVVAQRAPTFERPVQAEALDGLDRAVDGDPGHDLRMGELPARAAHFPDPLVGLAPGDFEEIEQGSLDPPGVVVRLDADAPALCIASMISP